MEQEDTVDYNIRKTWYNITKMYNRTATEYMASMALGMIILNIDIMDGTPSTQLGPNMGMEATSLSRSLNKLEDAGVIKRKADPHDKRKSVIHLTPLGMHTKRVFAYRCVRGPLWNIRSEGKARSRHNTMRFVYIPNGIKQMQTAKISLLVGAILINYGVPNNLTYNSI